MYLLKIWNSTLNTAALDNQEDPSQKKSQLVQFVDPTETLKLYRTWPANLFKSLTLEEPYILHLRLETSKCVMAIYFRIYGPLTKHSAYWCCVAVLYFLAADEKILQKNILLFNPEYQLSI